MTSKLNKRKVVTFQLVHRSVEDPLNADPNAPEQVLVPIHIGEDVDPELVEQLQKQMTPEARKQQQKKPKTERKGIGARYNKFFGEDLPDDGEDYSQYFKAIDEENDDGVFVAPDGSVHDLRKREVEDVDILVDKLGITNDMFGTKEDPNLPKLVNDTDNPLAAGIDPELLMALDDDDAPPFEDDFVSKLLDAELNEEEDEEDDGETFTDRTADGREIKKTISRVSATASHMSHISHRSHAMDLQEKRVDYFVKTLFEEEEDAFALEEDNLEPAQVDWADIAADMQTFEGQIKLNPVKPSPETCREVTPSTEQAGEEEEEMEEEEERRDLYKLDIRSVAENASTTNNLPAQIRDGNRKKKSNKKKQEEEEEVEAPLPPEFAPKPGETKEEAKARKKAIKEYQRQKRMLKKERKVKFSKATNKVRKSIAANGATRGTRVYNLD
ncbi:Low temperature viability protein [Trichomonas vaginalis G3]|uniref:Low temperature viability protein n=1 Tax=Trichomonas vaginalis (strain ATCC PRA-98 / G3) TaxID=412133 RepID=A2DGC4_TRIV3|nr:low-temperature viability protein LTV1-related family [Trichomonas vaginalis G3]EAY20520.1 Low temperature viability protein [Trichomonas vaginalis G3]KAI5488303.1 low-temperature viability protein LTV1-related family [Trichomonas vaginalis G3]|eukprot:XP_001581506.1 Low temperature viability protein [Trichomonas vaginalis G3]